MAPSKPPKDDDIFPEAVPDFTLQQGRCVSMQSIGSPLRTCVRLTSACEVPVYLSILISSPINYANHLIGSSITSQSTAAH